jgi:surface antigen
VTLYGDAYTWWDKAAGKFIRSAVPSEGAVMVLYNYAGPARGHVAVVRAILDSRTIKIDHANWLDDGAIYVDDPVRDVSADNDWSQVRVFNLRTRAWGGRIYPVQGFIGPGPDAGRPDWHVAQNPPSAQGDAISALLRHNEATDE